jgi:hypothetical protein
MNSPDQFHWLKSVLRIALTLLAAAIALSVAVRLIRAALPELVTISVISAVGYVAWVLHARRNRW